MSECWGQHWGEIAPMVDLSSKITAVERAELTAIQPIGLQTLKIGCIPQESYNTGEDNETDIGKVPIGNPIVLHTIKLLQFSRKLNQNNDNNSEDKVRESIPQIMKINEMNTKKLNVFTIKDRNFSEKAVKKLLRRAVIIIAVFYGYEFTEKSVIDLMVDILSEYLSRLCQTIRMTTDSLELMSSNDFIDVMDRVFHDMNVSDFESLRQFDSDLKLYNQNLIKEVNKKIGINESINGSNKIRNSFQMDSNCDLGQSSPITQSENKGLETTLSLKSLLSSFKTNNTEETEQLFDLTSLANTSSNKSDES